MALKNSWLGKENHSGHPMHQYSGGDSSRASDWGMWRHCGNSSGTRASMGGYPALEGRLLEIARHGYFEGPVNKVLSGIRMAEKAGVIQSLLRGSDWIFAKSLEKLRQKKNSRRIQWSPSGILYEVAAGKRTFTWPEMECIALAALSLCNVLRIGEAWTAHRSGLGQLVFQGEKSRLGVQVQDVGPWAERWIHFLDEERRRRGGTGAVAYNFSSPSALEAQWVELVGGTGHRSLQWHGHRRGGAAQAWAAGARGPLVQLMGGWCTPTVAVSYATPTHAWEFKSRRRQPIPVPEGGEMKVAFGEWSALQWWGTWVRREIRELGRGATENGAILGSVDMARKRRRANSTGAGALRFDPEAVEDSADEGEGIANAGD